MIKFFRRLRRKLLNDHKFSKYFLYATGEISLVVIGILIALQINNWNEYRKDRIVEKEILQNLAESLETTTRKIQAHIASNTFCDKSSDIIIKSIENKQPYNDSLNKYFGWALAIEDPGSLVSFVGYESLKNMGLEIITNKFLRQEIILYFEDTIQLSIARKDRMMAYTMDLVRLRQEHFLREEDFNFAPFDYEKLIINEKFHSWLRTIKYSRNWFNQSLEEGIAATNRLHQLVREELGKLEFGQ